MSSVSERLRLHRLRLVSRIKSFFCPLDWDDLRLRDRNLVSGCLGVVAFLFLLTSLADKDWFFVEGNERCTEKHIGVAMFYFWGTFTTEYSAGSPTLIYSIGGRRYYDCVNAEIVQLFRGLMGIGFVATGIVLVASVLDVVGVHHGFPKWIRRNSILYIFAVFLCIPMLGLSYWISLLLERFHGVSLVDNDDKQVSFEHGFYMVIAAAFFSIIAIAANLIRSALLFKRETEERLRLTAHEQLPDVAAAEHGHLALVDPASQLMPGGAPAGMAAAHGGLAADYLSVDLLLRVPPPPRYTPHA